MTREPMTIATMLLEDARNRIKNPGTAQQFEDALALVRATHDLDYGIFPLTIQRTTHRFPKTRSPE